MRVRESKLVFKELFILKTSLNHEFCFTFASEVTKSGQHCRSFILLGRPMDQEFDYIVVGAGINGSWTGYHLAKLNKKVLVIEQVTSLAAFLPLAG